MLSSRLAQLNAAVGAFVWAVTLVIPTAADSFETLVIQKILLFAIFVIVPLGLALIGTGDDKESRLFQWTVRFQPLGAVFALVSFFFEPGPVSGSLAILWLVITVLIALVGVVRVLAMNYKFAELCIVAGLAYLPVGGVWFILSRFGSQPLGFGETIVTLTAVHFHYAGFAAPIIVGLTGRVLLRSKYPQAVYVLSVIGVVLSMPLIAAGITFSPRLALLGAAIISVSLVLLAALILGWVLRLVQSLFARILLVVSSLSSCAAMILACLYAYSITSNTLIIDIPTMAETHGLLNAFGFSLSALIAWNIETASSGN